MNHSTFTRKLGKKRLLAVAIASTVLGTASSALAQSTNENVVEEEILVTGIRGSLKASIDAKRNATSIVDAINSEDIGKFPDKNVADSLQRIPGVSVDRGWGEGRDIFVRGTDSTMNRTLMNGQNVASAFWWANDNPSRGFNYSILASELVSSLEVYKSPQAKHDEGSIGGMVNVKTRKPLDLDPLTINATVEAQYSELPDEWDPQFSGLLSWSNADETFGILGSFSSQKRTMRRDGLEAFPTNSLYDVVDQDGNVTEDVYAAWGGGSAIFSQDRERNTANLTAQFKPDDNLEMTFNYVNSDMDMDNNNQNYLWIIGGTAVERGAATAGVAGSNPVIYAVDPEFSNTSDGNSAVVGGVFNVDGVNGNWDQASAGGVAIEPIYRTSYVQSQVSDFNINYTGDNFDLHLQLGNTNAKGGSSMDVGYWFQGDSRTRVTQGNGVVEVDYLDLDPTNHSALTMGSARDWVREMTDDEWYYQGDLSFSFENNAITSLDVGLKFRDHTIENTRATGATNSDHAAWEDITMDRVSGGLTPELHGEAATSGSLTQYAWIDGGRAQSVIHPMFDAGVMEYNFDTNAYYELNEEITAAYVQANFESGIWSGNFGARVISTDQTSKAFINGALGSVDRNYTETLPSVNVIGDLSDDIKLRAAASRAMARPTFGNLSSNLVINATSGVATAGNPNLDATLSDQFEVGAEWYFQEASLASATLFYKDLDTYIQSTTQNETIDGVNLSVTRPTNGDGATLTGLELQYQQDFGSGFGFLTNVTLTEADTSDDLELPGNSKEQANLSGYFENDLFAVRLSYNYRSESYGGFVSGSQSKNDAYGQWDLSSNINLGDSVELYLLGVNLTNEIVKTNTSDGLPIGYYENGPRYSLGARFKF